MSNLIMHQEALTEKGAKLFPKLKMFDDFYLAGGTALALQIGHRVSVDFDLFCPNDISKDLLEKIKTVFQEQETDISPLVNDPDELSIIVDEVKMTFLKYPYMVLNKFSDLDGIKSLDILELSATKAYSIGRRSVLKDYVDLFFVLSEKHADLNQIIELADRKYGFRFNSRIFLERLIYQDDIDDVEIIFLKNHINKKEILDFFTQEIKKIKL